MKAEVSVEFEVTVEAALEVAVEVALRFYGCGWPGVFLFFSSVGGTSYDRPE